MRTAVCHLLSKTLQVFYDFTWYKSQTVNGIKTNTRCRLKYNTSAKINLII